MDAVPIVTVEQLAEMLACSTDTVRSRAAELGGLKFGRDYVFPAAALNQRLTELALAKPSTGGPAAPAPAAIQLRQVATTRAQHPKRRGLPRLP